MNKNVKCYQIWQQNLTAKHLEEALAPLHEARRRQGLLEEVERVVVVEDLDGRADGRDFLRAHLLHDVVELDLLRARGLQLDEEAGVLRESILRVREVVLRVDLCLLNFILTDFLTFG